MKILDSGIGSVSGVFIPKTLSVLVPGSLAGMAHDEMIVNDVIIQETPCTVCVETRATALQVLLGSTLPYAGCLLGLVLWGKKDCLKWIPGERSGKGAWFNFYRNTLMKSSKMMTLVTVSQMLLAGGLVYAENESFHRVMSELDTRIAAADARKLQS